MARGLRSYEDNLIRIPTAPRSQEQTPRGNIIGRRRIVDASNPRFRSPSGQKLFQQEKYEADQFNELQKFTEQGRAKAEAQKLKEQEARRRFEQTQGAINERSLRPYKQATDSAYDLLATTPTITRKDELGNPMGRSRMTRQEGTQMLLDKFKRANMGDPRIRELLSKQPTSYSDISLEKPLSAESFKQPEGEDDGGSIGDWMKSFVSQHVAPLTSKLFGGSKKSAAPEPSGELPQDAGAPDESDFQEPQDQGTEPPQFDSEEEINAAGLKPGTQIKLYDPQTKKYRPAVYE